MANNSLDRERTLKEKLDELAAIEAEEREKQEAIQAEIDRKENAENAIKKAKEDRLEKERKRFSENFRREGNTVYFGMYPQSKRAGNVIVFDEKNEDGYHKASDGCSYVFNEKNGVYYKVEPIRWKVLYENDTEIKLVCDSIIDNRRDLYSREKDHLENFLDIAFDRFAIDPHICDISYLTTHELEYIKKTKRKRRPTDYAKREKKCSDWMIKGPSYQWHSGIMKGNDYKLDAFKNAKKAKYFFDFGIVPCIKVKKSITLADIEEKCVYWHRMVDQDWCDCRDNISYSSRRNTPEFCVAPFDSVKKGDVIMKVKVMKLFYDLPSRCYYNEYAYEEEINIKAMLDGTVISIAELKNSVDQKTPLIAIV